jgi:hypothetical protein
VEAERAAREAAKLEKIKNRERRKEIKKSTMKQQKEKIDLMRANSAETGSVHQQSQSQPLSLSQTTVGPVFHIYKER